MRWRTLIPVLIVVILSVPMEAGARGHGGTEGSGPAEPDPTSPAEVFTQMQHSFRADKAKGQHLRYQFNFNDPQGGKWWLEIKDDNCAIGRGILDRPDVTFYCTGADWVRLSNGTLGGLQAFITGRLRVSGNQFTAHKLDEIFP